MVPAHFPLLFLCMAPGQMIEMKHMVPINLSRISSGVFHQKDLVILRYEKRTKHYLKESTAIHNFTVQVEIIYDAIAAINVLNNISFLAQSRIFVLGHSLGGMMTPRIVSQDEWIIEFILFAAPARPLENLILEQSRYLASLSGNNQSGEI
ncbi:hypothetical protein AYK25_02245 [Thermoplasmatales archaeon SM1-50]|nr:MAG: hypothetical protein AYK25_02245 [Thermoplasmatales archaeon SM1-50]